MSDEFDRILDLPAEQFGEALGSYLRRRWRESLAEGIEDRARLQRQWRLEAAERRRIRLQNLFLQDHLKWIAAAVHHHDYRTPRQLLRVAKGLRRAVARRNQVVS